MPTYPEEHTYHSNIWGPPLFLNLDTNHVLGHILVHSTDKNHVLVVTVQLIWLFLDIILLKFVQIPNKSLGFKRFRSYVNHPAVVLIKVATFLFFCSCLSPVIVHLRVLFLLSTPVARMLLTQRWVSRRKDVK